MIYVFFYLERWSMSSYECAEHDYAGNRSVSCTATPSSPRPSSIRRHAHHASGTSLLCLQSQASSPVQNVPDDATGRQQRRHERRQRGDVQRRVETGADHRGAERRAAADLALLSAPGSWRLPLSSAPDDEAQRRREHRAAPSSESLGNGIERWFEAVSIFHILCLFLDGIFLTDWSDLLIAGDVIAKFIFAELLLLSVQLYF